MSVVVDLVSFFESLNNTMESKKSNLTRKGSSKSVPEKASSRVKRYINDLTDIKRPPGKQKTTEVNTTTVKSRTLPRNHRDKPQDHNKKCDSIPITKHVDSNNEIDENTAGVSRVDLEHYESTTNNGLSDKFNVIFEKTFQIEKKVEEFAENLKLKRIQHSQQQHEVTSEGIISPKNESSENVSQEHDTAPHAIEENNNIYVNDEEESSEGEDMFGSNDFDEDQPDNFIVETYNQEGHELVITTLQITRRTVTQSRSEDDIDQLIEDSDYVVHKCEYDGPTPHNSCSSENEIVYENTSNTQQEDYNHSLKNTSYLYTNFPDSPTFSDCDSLYEEIPITNNNDSEQNITRVNFNYADQDKGEDNFYDAVLDFSSTETISIPGDVLDSSNEILISKINNEKKEKINYVVEEMIHTEEQYIFALEKVIKKYIPYMYSNTPQDLLGKPQYLFGNIEEIYKNSKQFLHLLKATDKDSDSIAQIFIDCASHFDLYPLYSKNKPTSDLYLKQFDHVIKNRQIELKDKLGLASHLLTPIQRLGKYVLLLEQIHKELRKLGKPSETIIEAISVVRRVMRKGNDFIAIDSIKNSNIDLTMQGSFIIRGLFNIFKPRKFQSMVFLFENVIVFTERNVKQVEQFRYVDSISMSDLLLGKLEDKPLRFTLTIYSKSKKPNPEATYVLEADTPKVKNDWTEIIENKLWIQLEKAKEQQKKVSYTDHRHQARTPASRASTRKSKSYRLSAKSKATSRFYEPKIT